MGGTSPAPRDNSLDLERMRQQEADRAREQQRYEDEQKRSRFETNLSNAYTTGIDGARNYFISQGLDPERYMGAISQGANSARSRVADLDSSPGTYFENLGAQIFDREQEGARNKALRGFDSFAKEGFARRAIGNDVDDPFLSSILEESRANADDYARNLLDRGVITNSGYEAALGDLDKQRAGANLRLQDIGLAELERGRGQLRDIAAEGRSAASQLRLGDDFDPYSYQKDINKTQADFFTGLGDNLRANAPDDLFDTSGLAGIAGASQGAQNTAFDPNALAGFGDKEDEEKEDEEDFVAF